MAKDISFEGQKEDEEIFIFIRQHPFIFLKEAVILIFSVALLAIIIYFQQGVGGIFAYAFFILLVVNLSIWARQIFIWSRSVYIITNQRIISVDQKGFFYRTMAEANLDKIQNVSHTIKGVWQTVLNFGSVAIQTAGYDQKNIVLEQIPHPLAAQQEIMKIASEYGGAPIKVELGKDKVIR